MKKLFAAIAIAGTVVFASAQTISFDKTVIDYGTIAPGADGVKVFTFKNTGNKPLIISKANSSCGCTVPDWSKDPIMPGKSGEIKVQYDTKRVGTILKMIEVYSNDPENGRVTLNIKGNVDPKAGESK